MTCLSLSRPGKSLRILKAITFVVQFVADGVFYAELNELLTRELAEHGYSGVEVRVTPMKTEVIIRATRTQNVLGDILRTGLSCLRIMTCEKCKSGWTGWTPILWAYMISFSVGDIISPAPVAWRPVSY